MSPSPPTFKRDIHGMMQRADTTESKTKLQLCSEVLWEFVLYSFIGWAYETLLTSIVWGEFAERGFLHLPLCVIYGFSAMLLIFVLRKIKSAALIFLAGGGIVTVIELAASYVLEAFGEKLWDYEGWALNFQGRISLGSSLIFGVLCVILMKLIHPLCLKIYEKISPKAIKISALILLLAILADFIITLLF